MENKTKYGIIAHLYGFHWSSLRTEESPTTKRLARYKSTHEPLFN